MQTYIQGWQKLPYKKIIYVSLGLVFLDSIAILILKNFLPPQIPLFYGKPIGEEQLTTSFGFLIAPAASLTIIILNTALSLLIDDQFLKKALIFSSFFISILITMTIFKIIFLVGLF